MNKNTKIVDYHIYCEQCKHYEKTENEDPCDICLMNPANEYSHKPVNFEPKEK